ncbi:MULTISPECIES: amidohydrolase [unclassified Actinopolyspora]|uniref:amidohydrolase n=1 Tax=unclassified Actinopolyspora TaxID=2639451 RepID=UPI0013F5D6EC|nr:MULTISPECIES: amidohydrolase [unclassified Actinopolyspora]NHD17720.1 amidohydrolase [Actinopolyspora sp. BKK2]NHE76547.1 amidohydrolase [Actinopolyspora sp. BKK1]
MSDTTLLLGGRIYSPGNPDATAMAVKDGTVAWVGTDTVGRALHPEAEIVDLDGAFVAPAFVDSHVHATSSGLLLNGLDLTGCASLTEFLHALRDYVAEHPGRLVWGHGWDESWWPEQRPPTRAEIDDAARGEAVYLSRIDVHSALVSSALIERAPLARGAEGWDEHGPLTRVAHHHARSAARESLSAAQRREAQAAFLRHAAARGIASVHECAGPDISGADDLADLLGLSERGGVPEVVGYWGELGALEKGRELGVHGLGGDLFVDGALGSRTAALREPYADAPGTSGVLYLDADAIAEHLVECTRNGMQAGFHVIGDAGVAEVGEGFRRAARVLGTPALASARHRLEHLEMIDGELAAELAEYGVAASVQPCFDASWGGTTRMYASRLGPERGARLNPFSELASSGLVLAFGSDTPVTQLGPWEAIRAAVHHRTEGFGISPRAAFNAHTRGGWRAAGVDDGLTGTLVPGAPATYAVWSVDELVPAGQDSRVRRWSTDPRSGVPALPDVSPQAKLPRCLRTVLRGKTIHQRNPGDED